MSFAKTKAILLILAAALIILSACAPATAPTDVPAAQTITVQRTESLAWVDPLFSACVPDQAGVGLLIQSQPLTNLNLSAAEVTLRWDEPHAPEGYGAVLGSDEVVVVMPNDNPTATISADQLKTILSGGARQWSELCADCSALPEGEINLYIFPSDQEAQSILAVDLGLSVPLSSFATLVPIWRLCWMRYRLTPMRSGSYQPAHWMSALNVWKSPGWSRKPSTARFWRSPPANRKAQSANCLAAFSRR